MVNNNYIPWDGTCPGLDLVFSAEEIKNWNMMQHLETGSIYYTTHDERPTLNVWCCADRLKGHLQRLAHNVPSLFETTKEAN